MFDGLVVQWTLDPDAFDIVDVFEHFYVALRPQERASGATSEPSVRGLTD